ncbi:GTPase-activating protein BEM3 [Aspergillus novofumigatus IBT 16806]|uniref:RhoGAP domain protein n=1 Tax=Aspergillus novofumigatus (strain IBT 16806) TaxID=1392255 RepID=A0A2I1CDP8_ASPN1|nr:RhoGAP domain protein [Aspergillus novofumigatus IBT 16806]PKX95745.1 RhoGAP domain protein [Aspergillus novofumigatus IBT 16806]
MSQLRHDSDNNPSLNQPPAAYSVSQQARDAGFPRSPLTRSLIPRDYLVARADAQPLRSGVVAVTGPSKPTPSPLNTSDRCREDRQDNSSLLQSPVSPRSSVKTVPPPNHSSTSRIAHAPSPSKPSGSGQKSTTSSAGDRARGDLKQHGRGMTAIENDIGPRKLSNTGDSVQSPSSPVSLLDSLQSMSGDRTPGHRVMPRTSSIDSAISSLSSASQPHKSSFDASAVSQADIDHLIATAGSTEAVIIHLLKEKHHAASQNAQLWRLVDKQRTLILGLNKDLERALKEKERYKKRAKELQNSIPPVPSNNDHVIQSRGADNSVIRVSRDLSKQEQVQGESSEAKSTDAGMQDLCDSPVLAPIAKTDRLSPAGADSPRLKTTLTTEFDNELSRPGQTEELDQQLNSQSLAYSRKEMSAASPTSLASSSSALNETLPSEDRQQRLPHPSRKPPPAPLKLGQTQRAAMENSGIYDSESDYEDILEVDELPVERGRRKTRDDDDREREAALDREMGALKAPGEEAPQTYDPNHLSGKTSTGGLTVGISKDPWQPISSSSPIEHQDSLTSVQSPQNIHAPSLNDQPAFAVPKSPGLPLSPRPEDRPIGSPLPRMPREVPNSLSHLPFSSENSLAGLALSPRSTNHPNPFAPGASMPTDTSPSHIGAHRHIPTINHGSRKDNPRSPCSPAAGIYQGLMSEDYPGLLLPPNALPLIRVKVSSSRLRPSRNSYMAPKPSEEEPVFTLGVFSRSENLELWRVEKVVAALPQLDQQIRQSSALWMKLPDRSIFSGHSPAKIDARRAALNSYFEALLDTPVDERAALAICQFLTLDAIEPRDDESSLLKGNCKATSEALPGQDGKPQKEGYLTKRGKNFGGWKARYFILYGPELKYFESPGGPHLGTIKIFNAQIGKQSQPANNPNNPLSGAEDDSENQYRHAFLILEPKRKDSSALVRHVLCAESDEERDAWVEALLAYVEGQSDNEGTENTSPQSQVSTQARHVPQSTSKPKLFAGGSKKSGKGMSNAEMDLTDTVQGFSYDDAVPAEPPLLGPPSEKQPPRSPMFPLEAAMESSDTNPASDHVQLSSKVISGPTNGTVIQDAGAWGNKTVTSTKEKKRSIWGFRTRSSYDLASQLQASQEPSSSQAVVNPSTERKDLVRPVFGIPLAEAVQHCAPQGVDVDLPAVVYRCIEYLKAKGAATEEGIFRLSGSNVVVKALKERFNTEGDVDFLAGDEYYDVHAVASLFKQYLRELPTTVLTRELHLDFLRVLELDERQKKILAFNSLIHRLPRPNLALLRALVQFLIIIVNNSDVNKMTIRNVGIVFAPTLNIPAPVFSMFLTDFESIFDKMPEGRSEPVELKVDRPALPEDIRSPRHQMFSDLPTPAYNQTTFRKPTEVADDLRHDTGFISVQPSYEQSSHNPVGHYNRQPDSPAMNRMLMPSVDNSRSAKAKRRESSMLFMEYNHQGSGLPAMRNDQSKCPSITPELSLRLQTDLRESR